MLCNRCGKEKRDTRNLLCFTCAHQRPGAQHFKAKRLALVQVNMAKVKADRKAMDGMNSALDRFFKKADHAV